MGLFDNVLKSLDSTLQAIEEGAIEKKLTEAVDALDRATSKAPEMLEKAANMPEQAVQAVEDKAAQLKESGEVLKEQAGKAVDVIQRD